ncbi:transglycosylase SLT domain-containing protein [Photobacterium minamisatsumaniensis]|uniref:transglycosylase SLT domain-containing protein n=1 Tax=Photobacterium minamisatsumaniensis TaxID=2910233 RepID=UPI003D1446CC
MKLTRLACYCALLLSVPFAHANDPFAELDAAVAEANQPQSQRDAEFEAFVLAYLGEYESWRSEYLKEFDEYRAEVIAKWGDGMVSQRHISVDYSDNKETRTLVDFEKNEATIALVVDADTSIEQAKQQLEQATTQALSAGDSALTEALDAASSIPVGEVVEAAVDFSDEVATAAKKVIVEQTRTQLQEIDKESESLLAASPKISTGLVDSVTLQKKEQLLTLTAERLESLDKTYEDARAKASLLTKKKIIEYRIQLPENGLGKRAAKYVDFAEKESERFDIPAALVMAIMHSESSFNPKAKSPIPAYGLMQIVPTTAGHDVNARIRKINGPMRPAELYMADVNVETGTAYLNILDKSYLKTITNPTSRLYCTIAAYNTGAGNVAKAFNPDGSRNIRKAAKVINTLSPDEVYQKLLQDLPYDETKNYLKKVSTRIALYEKHTS